MVAKGSRETEGEGRVREEEGKTLTGCNKMTQFYVKYAGFEWQIEPPFSQQPFCKEIVG